MVRRHATLDPLRASGLARLRYRCIAVWRKRKASTASPVGTCQMHLKIAPGHRRAGAGSLVSRCRREPPGSHGGPCSLVAMVPNCGEASVHLGSLAPIRHPPYAARPASRSFVMWFASHTFRSRSPPCQCGNCSPLSHRHRPMSDLLCRGFQPSGYGA